MVWHPSLSRIGGWFIGTTGNTESKGDGSGSNTSSVINIRIHFFFLCYVWGISTLVTSGDLDWLWKL